MSNCPAGCRLTWTATTMTCCCGHLSFGRTTQVFARNLEKNTLSSEFQIITVQNQFETTYACENCRQQWIPNCAFSTCKSGTQHLYFRQNINCYSTFLCPDHQNNIRCRENITTLLIMQFSNVLLLPPSYVSPKIHPSNLQGEGNIQPHT